MTPADIPLLSRYAVRSIDEALIARGVPGVLLMENAGRGAAEGVARLLGDRPSPRVGLLVGPGNNGGDALVVARHLPLLVPGCAVAVMFLAPPEGLKGDAAVMLRALTAVEAERCLVDDATDLDAWMRARDCVVDGLFGTGLTRPLHGPAARLVTSANGCEALRVSLDLPSGIDADTGAVLGPDGVAFMAHHTFTFARSKPGLHTGPGLTHAGEVTVVGLGVPLPKPDARVWLSAFRPPAPRGVSAHKGDAGHVFVVGGSAGTTGAALLSARGAHRAGAGLVTIASRAVDALSVQVTETMTLALPDDPSAVEGALSEVLTRASAIVVGPGLGRDAWARAVTRCVVEGAKVPVVVDADALGHLDRQGTARGATRVLTPHPMEMARLMGVSGARPAGQVNDDRLRFASDAARMHGAVTVLKGAGTVVTDGGEAWIHPYADPTLGVAGSGDVLTGVIAARLAERREITAIEAVNEAVHAHGRAGERVHAERGAVRGALASEVADAVSAALEG